MNIDIIATPSTDLVSDVTLLPMFSDRSVDEIRLEAVYEHLFRHQRRGAIREWFRLLRPGGRLRLEWIPDFDQIVDAYTKGRAGLLGPRFDIDGVYRYTHGDPVAWNAPEQLHKDVFTKESVGRELREAGFEIEQVENVRFADEALVLNLSATARKPE